MLSPGLDKGKPRFREAGSQVLTMQSCYLTSALPPPEPTFISLLYWILYEPPIIPLKQRFIVFYVRQHLEVHCAPHHSMKDFGVENCAIKFIFDLI